MAAPAAPAIASAAAEVVDRVRPRIDAPRPPKRGGNPLALIAAALIGLLLLPALIVVVLLTGAQLAGCAPAPQLPGSWTGPGSLGGVAGTGVTAAELAAARRIPGVGGRQLTPGTYSPTAYLPSPHAPSTNCGSTCTTTASGIRVANATRRAYLIASNPQLNQYGALAYIWPNPYGWRGPFVVADTGGAFGGVGRLDFYIFIDRGETWQQALARAYQWGPANRVTVSARPIRPGGPTIATPGGDTTPAAGCAVASDPERAGRIAQIAARHVGSGPSIPGFTPPSTDLAWCAWFASNVWRQAGVPIEVTYFSGALYGWAQEHNGVWKAVGQAPPSRTPPLGAALLYGTGPQSTASSLHLNLVTKVNADGSFMTIGGNESDRVGLSGPCRLAGGSATRLAGPGCDGRPIYAIVTPGAPA